MWVPTCQMLKRTPQRQDLTLGRVATAPWRRPAPCYEEVASVGALPCQCMDLVGSPPFSMFTFTDALIPPPPLAHSLCSPSWTSPPPPPLPPHVGLCRREAQVDCKKVMLLRLSFPSMGGSVQRKTYREEGGGGGVVHRSTLLAMTVMDYKQTGGWLRSRVPHL